MLEYENFYKRGSNRESSVLSHHAVCKEGTKMVAFNCKTRDVALTMACENFGV